MIHSIQRKLLRVDLTERSIQRSVIDDEDVTIFLGGRVLGDIYLYRELLPSIDPLSPENQLIFGTGPLTGTSAPGSSRYIVHAKSPQTGLYMNSLAGGYFGPELRKAGFDMVIIQGKAEKPVYLSISNDNAELKDAGPIWGMDTQDTQQFIKSDLQDDKVRIACIGPAGENLVCYAAIISERRAAGRGGGGGVMGSKNLKAIAVRGTNKVQIADPEAFKNVVKRAYKDIAANEAVAKGFPLYGTLMAMPTLNDGGITPWRNWQNGGSDKAVNLYAQTWRDEYVKKDVRCSPPCNLKCSKLVLSREGPHAGVLTEGPDYETEYSFGASCNVTDQAAVIEADALCDKLGLDTISTGLTIAFAMECYEKGIITSNDTDGEEILFGRSELLPKLIHKIAYRRNFGALLSLGSKRMSEKLGKGSEAFAMHAKGMELGGYDPRGAKSLALIYACGSRGGCHKSGGAANGQSLRELSTGTDRFLNQGKAAITQSFRDSRMIADSAILCAFPYGSLSPETILSMLNAATGFHWSKEDLQIIAERGNQIERAFNVREGLRRAWDTLPDRILNEGVKTGSTAGQTVDLDVLIDDFYELSGWDLKTGIPKLDTLKKLGLHMIAKDMEMCIKE
ncbi:MAG: aldehyde ferredoxin oxidoreductase family protein [Deltaproteobacteria bacterium]|nr:aldehyde ferredoxin oxidoreductase family protein [Deltaproteobacteria bacterium]